MGIGEPVAVGTISQSRMVRFGPTGKTHALIKITESSQVTPIRIRFLLIFILLVIAAISVYPLPIS